MLLNITPNKARLIATALEFYNANLDTDLHVFKKQGELCNDILLDVLDKLAEHELTARGLSKPKPNNVYYIN